MIINHNMNAMNAHRNMVGNTAAAGKSMEKLSSGLRINRAGDDAAGLAISEKMRGQIRGLDQASRNSQDGISMIQTAEGALNETHSILQRMRELAVQSSSDTNNDADRGQIQKEIVQLKSEIDRISTTTEFNTKKLLDGSMGTTATAVAGGTAKFGAITADADIKADTYKVTLGAAGTLTVNTTSNTTALKADGTNFDLTAGKISGLQLGDYTVKMTVNSAGTAADISLVNSDGVEVAKANSQGLTAGALTADATLAGNVNGVATTFTVKTGAAAQTGEMKFTLGADLGAAGNFKIEDSAAQALYTNTLNEKVSTANYSKSDLNFKLTADAILTAGSTSYTVSNSSATLQIGANQNQTTNVGIQDMSTKGLNIQGVDLSTKAGAQNAVTSINDAIEKVSSERATLGAKQNRLEHTIANLNTSSENLQSSESRVRDVDMAKEMMTFSKNNILAQAAQAMLAQANQQPQGVLQLLR